MTVYFENTKNKDLVALKKDGVVLCNHIAFDIAALPPQVHVALEAAYRAGVEDGNAQKQAELRKLMGCTT